MQDCKSRQTTSLELHFVVCRFQVNNRWTIRRRLCEFLLSAFLRRDTSWEMCRIRTTIERFQRKTTNRLKTDSNRRYFFLQITITI